MDDRYGDMPPLVDQPSQHMMGFAPAQPGFGPPPPGFGHPGFGGQPGFGAPPPTPSPGMNLTPGVGYAFMPSDQGWGSSPFPGPVSMPVIMPADGFAPVHPTMPQNMGGYSHDGWPRPLATSTVTTESDETALPWKHDDGFPRSAPNPSHMRAPTPQSMSSLTSSPSSGGSGGSLSRNHSLHGPHGEVTKRPPREWRSDFSMSGGGLLNIGAFLTRSRSRSVAGLESYSPPKVQLNPYIRYNSSKPPMHLDLRRSPNTLKLRALKTELSRWDLQRFVCEPPLTHMRLFHAHFPWYIDIHAENPVGVTLFDLFAGIHLGMMAQIEMGDYYNIEMDNEAREEIAYAWSQRSSDEQERSRGIRRVDYLMGRVIMEGIQKGRDGLWEIKTRRPS